MLLAISPYLLPISLNLVRPAFWNPDLDLSNIFVCTRTNKITVLEGWHDASVGPLLLQTFKPPLPRFEEERLIMLPKELKDSPLEDQESMKRHVERWRVVNAWQTEIDRRLPVLKPLLDLPCGMLMRYVVYSARSGCVTGNLKPLRYSLAWVQQYVP